MDKLKYVKLENEDGSYSESIPLAVDSNHVDINGRSLSDVIVEKADVRIVDNNIEMLTNEVNLANSRIDNLAHLEDGSTTGDAELIDGRVAYTGRVYDSIGENLRTSFENIYMSLEEINGKMTIPFGQYGWQWVDENTAPTLGTYKGAMHSLEPVYLQQGSTIKVQTGAKYSCYYLSDNDNIYYEWKPYTITTDSIAPENGYYYITMCYTPEKTIPDTAADRALLAEKLEVVNTQNKINELEILKRQSADFLTGLNDRARSLLKVILENAVFTKDVKDLIIKLDGELAEKNEIVIAYPNKYVSNAQGDMSDSSVMSVLKDYYINPTKEITFFIDNGGNPPLASNCMVIWDENDEYLGYYMMSNSGRTNVEWKMKLNGSEKNVGRFRLSLYTNYIENCYAYETNSGIIIYAGKNSRYANKRTIWD